MTIFPGRFSTHVRAVIGRPLRTVAQASLSRLDEYR